MCARSTWRPPVSHGMHQHPSTGTLRPEHGGLAWRQRAGSSTAGRHELMPVQVQSPLAKGARAAPWGSKPVTQGCGEYQAAPGLAQRAGGQRTRATRAGPGEPRTLLCSGGERERETEREHSREGEGEVEALAQAPEHDEGARWEGARGQLAEGRLEAARRALAAEAAVGAVGAGAAVVAHAGHAAPCPAVHLTVLPCRGKATGWHHAQQPPTGSLSWECRPQPGFGTGQLREGVCGAAGGQGRIGHPKCYPGVPHRSQ